MKRNNQKKSGSQPAESYQKATANNLHLDKETQHGGWPEGEYSPKVNDRLLHYFVSMGLMEKKDIQQKQIMKEYIRQVLLGVPNEKI